MESVVTTVPREAPIFIIFMMACYTCQTPEDHLGKDHWDSVAGRESRHWLLFNGLIDSDNRATTRGEAWVKYICQTPLPIETWALPERKVA